MKKVIYTVPVFFAAFILGLFVAPVLKTTSSEPIVPAVVQQPAVLVMPDKLFPQVDTDPYIAEFAHLPEIAEWEEYKTKLIDVALHGNAYRKSEVIARNGQTWLGLFEENGKTYLREVTTKVTVDPTYKGYGDEDYVRLTVGQTRPPQILLKNNRRLKAGTVQTSYLGPSYEEMENRGLSEKEMKVGFKEEFEVGDKWYTLRVAHGKTKSGEKVNVLVLETEEATQVVTYNEYVSEPHTLYDTVGYLHWVGDLDRDGKLDLYIQHFGYEKGGSLSSLYLSSEADKGNMVKKAAWFGTAGC